MIEAAFAASRGGHLVSFPADLPAFFLFWGDAMGSLGGSPAAHVAALRGRQPGAAAAVAAGGERARRHVQRRRRARLTVPHRIQDAWNCRDYMLVSAV